MYSIFGNGNNNKTSTEKYNGDGYDFSLSYKLNHSEYWWTMWFRSRHDRDDFASTFRQLGVVIF